ncbi:glycosyltransferase family 2 protein [Porcipelethomonas sp.]|uniref:glycosyltransferase family 2 protein n=1 Tax=Porcipelethomonas sp. TaxID=2981675 RepID=UPI003EF3AA8C
MKSNIKDKVINVDRNKIILSVGMIVKNEEKHLDKCLSALKKLLDNVPSELIIVDTGSTDKTKEIALKYTDKVYDFEWINDFSAARNYGLNKAVGEWFMFIDADEYLDEDCDEMIKFFNMPEVRAKYNSASFYIRNYGGSSKKAVDQFLAPRIVRRFEGVHFYDPIHEYLPQPLPHGFFTTVFHHYGYAYESQRAKKDKAKRNLKPLFEEYEKNPTETRILSHLCDAVDGDESYKFEEKERYFLEYLDAARKDLTDPYSFGAFIKSMAFYIRNDKFKKAVELSDEYCQIEHGSRSITALTVYYLRTMAFINLDDNENALDSIEKYFEYYDKYKNGKLEMVELRFCTHRGLTELDYDEQLMNAARCSNNLERFDDSLNYLEKIDIEEMNYAQLRIYLNIVRDMIRKTKNYLKLAEIYKKITDMGDQDKDSMILYLMEQYYMEHPAEREKFVDGLLNARVDGPYIELIKLVKRDSDGKDINNDLARFIDSINCWDDGYSEAIYLAMKHDVDLSGVINKLSHNVLKETLQIISQAHIDYAEVALKYCQLEKFSDSIKKMLWMVSALEAAVLNSQELLLDDKRELYDRFVAVLSDYILNIYNPDLLNPEDVEVLPELHRFGYYMNLAQASLYCGNEISYIRCLKEALRLCKPMKDLVSFYLSEFENSLNGND